MSDREDLIAEAREFVANAHLTGRLDLIDRLADALESAPQATPDDARMLRTVDLVRVSELLDPFEQSPELDALIDYLADLPALAQATPTADRRTVTLTEWRDELARVWDWCLDTIEKNEINTQQARETNPYRKAES